MKRSFFRRLALVFLASTLTASFAQESTRIVILPFNTDDSLEVYSLGLATALQRSLNVIDNVYVPPVGDTLLVTQSLIEAQNIGIASIAEAFGANVVLSGQMSGDGANTTVLVGIGGPNYPQIENISVTADASSPQAVTQAVTTALLERLNVSISDADRTELSEVVAQIPSLPSLNAVAETSLRFSNTNLTNLTAASQLDSSSSWVLAEYARALALTGSLAQAEENSLKALSASANDVEAWATHGVILNANNKTDEALAAFDRALSLNPKHAPALVGKANLVADFAQASSLLESAIEAYPRLAEAYIGLALLQTENNDPQSAIRTLRRGTTQAPETLSLHQAFMELVLGLGDTSGAETYLRSAISAQTRAPSGLYGLATLLPPELENEALAIIKEGRAIYPNNPNLLIAEVNVLERQANFAEAEALVLNALVGNEDNLELINQLAILQAKQGKLDEARASFARVAGDNATGQYNLAQLFLEAGENEAALSTLEPLAQANPNDAEVIASYGLALGRTGRFQEALSAFDQALAIDPKQATALQAKGLLEEQVNIVGGQPVELSADASNLFSQGQNALTEGDYERAATLFMQARAFDDNGLIAFYEGYSLYFSGQTRQAVPAFTAALTAFPNSDIILNNLGLAQIELGRLDLALEHLNQAIELNPSNDQAHLNLGLAYYQLNDFAQAISAWETATSLNPALNDSVADLLADAREKSQ